MTTAPAPAWTSASRRRRRANKTTPIESTRRAPASRAVGGGVVEAGETPVAAEQAVGRPGPARSRQRPPASARSRSGPAWRRRPSGRRWALKAVKGSVASGGSSARGQRDQRGVDRHRGRDSRQQGDGAAPGLLLGRQRLRRGRGGGGARGQRGQLDPQRLGAGGAPRGVQRHRAGDHRAERRGLARQRGAVGIAAGHHVEEQRPEREDVAARVGGAPARASGAR